MFLFVYKGDAHARETPGAKMYEDLMQAELTERCTGCGSDIVFAFSVVVAEAERSTVCCRGCGIKQSVQVITYLKALQTFAAWLQDNQGRDRVSEARRKLQVLAFARFAFAHVVEEFRSHGGPDSLWSGLVLARRTLASAMTTVDESDCRLTLLLSGRKPDLALAYYTRSALAFSAYCRYTRDLLEALVGTTNCSPEVGAFSVEVGAELAQAYDELCLGTYTELREAIFALP